MEILCSHPDSCDIANDFKRVIYCLRIDATTFDLFFNSSSGYRAAYFRSPFEGLQANSTALELLTPHLVKSTTDGAMPPEHFIVESLTSPTAKIWLAEPEVGVCSKSLGSGLTPLMRSRKSKMVSGARHPRQFDQGPQGTLFPEASRVRCILEPTVR